MLEEDYEYEDDFEDLVEEDEVLELRPQEGAQERALQSTAEITIYGGAAGSGKSFMMLLRPLVFIDDPHFTGIYFRRTGPQLKGAGGLWNEAKAMYAPWNPHIHEGDRLMTFPSGATIQFSHMEHNKNRLDHQGLQYTHIYFDEGTHFEEEQVTYLMSRLRSKAKVPSTMFISCNPDPDSFIATYIDWWLDDDGFPDKAKSGVVKYYVLDNGVPMLSDTIEELRAEYPHLLRTYNQKTEKWRRVKPKTMTFIGGTIFDNPAMMKANPSYLAELNSLPDIEKQRLLHGNWYARPEGSGHYQRGWLIPTNSIPQGGIRVRAWDKASTQPSEKNKKPDYTACIGMIKDRWDNFYLVGDFHPQNKDKHDKVNVDVRGRFRERSGARDTLIRKQAEHDGKEVIVVLPKDPGAAGQTEYTDACKKLAGFKVKPDPMPTQTGKLTRYLPFSSAAENQLIYIVTSTFNKATLEAFHAENEAFDGERSSDNRKDDWPDCTASAYNYLCTARTVSTVARKQKTEQTLAAEVLESHSGSKLENT